ncbi:MAG: TasA family protein [Minisyncoccota bacterium]
MKRIILSLSMLAFAGALIIGGTGAFFSDTETSTGNTFTAGAIDLKIDSSATYNGENVASATWTLKDLDPTSDKFFNFKDIKPGDEGKNIISLHVENNEAWVCAAVSNLASDDNGLTEPEGDVDSTGGVGEGELDDEMLWSIWRDDNNNGVQDGGEIELTAGTPTNGVLALYDATTGSPLSPASTTYLGVSWTLPAESGNETQTDSLTGDISFSVVQSRNNDQFVCGEVEVEEPSDLEIVKVQDLGVDSWFFYNDTNDTLMSINQFNSTGGVNDIVAGPDSVGAAQMTLDDGTQIPDYDGANDSGNPRYNIATQQFGGVKLSDIDSLTYRIYDDSASSQTPYLHFNIDFNDTNTWQSRLVQVPTGITVDTWETVDALAGSWTYSGENWPVGVNTAVPFSGSTARTWADIIADYPNAELNDGALSFLGIRVGHPGPIGETGYVDWIEFDGVTTDFEV